MLRELARRGYDRRERKALAEVSALAAVRMLAAGRSLADFFEQVDYNGRRLAKLEIPPGRVVEELERVGRELDAQIREVSPRQAAELGWARRQLSLAVVIAMNNAFYRVREAETAALHALFRAELASGSHKELIARCLEILARWSGAAAGRLFLRQHDASQWRSAAAWPQPAEARAFTVSPELARRLQRPQHIRPSRAAQELALDPAWRGRYPSCWSIPLLRGKRLEGVLQLGFEKDYEWLPRELRLLEAAGERILEAAEKARLSEELVARERQVRALAEQMVHIEELERQRISQELHDEAGQSLLCLRLQLEMLEGRVAGADGLKNELAEARRLVERTIEDVRRLVADLSPSVLEDLGLAPALRRLVSRFRRLHPMRARLRIRLRRPLPKRLERVAYRLVQECLSNAGKHSSARHLNIFLEGDDKGLRIRVQDDGVGFQVAQALAQPRGFGLAGIRERVALLGGKVQIHSRPGAGTAVTIELPIPEPESDPGDSPRWPLAGARCGQAQAGPKG